MPKNVYRTNQKEQIRQCLMEHAGSHMTAMEIYAELKAKSIKVGLTTVYRHLEKLTGEGLAVKSVVDENTPACFEYTGHDSGETHVCYHCKCLRCGTLIHLHCDEVKKLEDHIRSDHGFLVDPMRTVFFGLCSDCQKQTGSSL